MLKAFNIYNNTLVMLSIPVKGLHDQGNSYKGHLIRAGLLFQRFIQYHHGGKHGSAQAGMVLKEFCILILRKPGGNRI